MQEKDAYIKELTEGNNDERDGIVNNYESEREKLLKEIEMVTNKKNKIDNDLKHLQSHYQNLDDKTQQLDTYIIELKETFEKEREDLIANNSMGHD